MRFDKLQYIGRAFYDPKYARRTCLATPKPRQEIMYAIKSGNKGESKISERTRNGSAIWTQ